MAEGRWGGEEGHLFPFPYFPIILSFLIVPCVFRCHGLVSRATSLLAHISKFCLVWWLLVLGGGGGGSPFLAFLFLYLVVSLLLTFMSVCRFLHPFVCGAYVRHKNGRHSFIHSLTPGGNGPHMLVEVGKAE